jgi:uncharacterized surface protein with fasciclin (FAS1) repeats
LAHCSRSRSQNSPKARNYGANRAAACARYCIAVSPINWQGNKVKSVYQIAAGLGALETWVAAVEAVGLVDLLKGDDYITVFAPNDEAFSKMSRNCVEELADDFEKFAANIRYHIAPGRVTSSELWQIDSLRTMLKEDLLIDARRGLQVNNARIVQPDIECRNGVIHVIDSVLMIRKHSKVRAGQFAMEPEYLNLAPEWSVVDA